jgi:hypothetical protein
VAPKLFKVTITFFAGKMHFRVFFFLQRTAKNLLYMAVRTLIVALSKEIQKRSHQQAPKAYVNNTMRQIGLGSVLYGTE